MEAVPWFDDRFYRTPAEKQQIEKLQKKVTKFAPKYEFTIVPSGVDDQPFIFLPSSTTILGASPKEWLAHWRGQVGNWEANRVMNEAMEKGSRVHHLFCAWVDGVYVVFNNPKAAKYTDEQIETMRQEAKKGLIVHGEQQDQLELWRLTQLFEILKPKVIATEFSLADIDEGHGGTLDHLWSIDKGEYDLGQKEIYKFEQGLTVLDLKTGSDNEFEHAQQLASYSRMVEKEMNQKVVQAVIIYSNANKKKGIEGLKMRIIDRKELDYHYSAFLEKRNIWYREVAKSPKVFDLPTLLRLN